MKLKFHSLALLALLAAAALMGGCTQIGSGNIGVESVLGQVKPETVPPGNYVTVFKTLHEVCGKEVPLHMDMLKPQTSDKITLQELDVDVYLSIDVARAPTILTKWAGDITEEKGEDCQRIGFGYAGRQTREVIFDVASKFPSGTIHTARGDMAKDIAKELQSQLDKSAGAGLFKVGPVNVRNLVTDPALDASIKAAAQQQFKKQEELTKKDNAQIQADRLRIEAQGEADAIRIKTAAINSQGGDNYVHLKAVEKWDGKLPVTSAGGAMPFITVK